MLCQIWALTLVAKEIPKQNLAVVTSVSRPDTSTHNAHYVSNREPLAPSAWIKLPVGAVKPKGFLLEYLRRQRDGMTGNLPKLSTWLQRDGNAWLSTDGKGKWGWEEVPYWLKGYGNLAYLLNDQSLIDETMVWIEAAFRSQRPDGNFGPLLTFEDDGSQDFWANMLMLFCLQSYYEHSKDPRVIDLMTKYFRYQLSVPDDKFLTHYWQKMRGGDNLYSVYWLYNRTGDAFLLELATKIHRQTADWTQEGTLPNWHNVNIAQSFGEPATYFLQSKKESDLQFAYKNFETVRKLYGQVPGGMFGGDENSRPGYDDPRQAIETCGIVEQMLSDETLLCITGDPFWADHCEDVAFNSYPAAVMPDFKGLRYLTSPNLISSDSQNHAPGFQNGGAMLAMNPLSHRCCQHNHSHGWPYFVEHLWLASPDNGLLAAMYSASEVTAKVGDGTEVTVTETTNYPFEEGATFNIASARPVAFPLYFRIPAWCKAPTLKVNGESIKVDAKPGSYLRVERTWNNGDTVELALPMETTIQRWPTQHDSVSVNYGPLTFSLKIGEKVVKADPKATALRDSSWPPDAPIEDWPAFEILPTTPWNFAFPDLVSPSDFKVVKRPWPKSDFPWTLGEVPLSLEVEAKAIPEWQKDQFGLVAALQDSPALSNQPLTRVELVPMGAARLRISQFPTATGDPNRGVKWDKPFVPPPPMPYNPTASHCFYGDSEMALCDNISPKSSSDESVPRMTWWDHKGTSEWVQYRFEEPKAVSGVEVYWFDDTGSGECRVPQSWRLLALVDGQWVPVQTEESYRTETDKFNRVEFKEVKTMGLRLEVQLRAGYSGGILEWRVLPR